MSLILSCVTAPGIRTSIVAELHYGDSEKSVVEKLGDGSEVLYLNLDGRKYRYRLYITQYTKDVYALLFTNGGLVAVHDEKQDFSECLNIDASTSWEQCLSGKLSEMSVYEISLENQDFSKGITTEQEEQADRDSSRAGGVAVAVPLSVALPGIVPMYCFFSCGQCDPGARSGDYPSPCMDSLSISFSQSVDILQGGIDRESIIKKIDLIQHEKSILSTGRGKNTKNNHTVLIYTWGCYGEGPYLKIRAGLSDEILQWAWVRYE